MKKFKILISILLVLTLLLVLYGCADNIALDNVNKTEISAYREDVKHSLKYYVDIVKAESDYTEEELNNIDTILLEAIKAIDKSNRYANIDKYEREAKDKICNIEIKLNYNAQLCFSVHHLYVKDYINSQFVEDNRTYGCTYPDPVTSEIVFDHVSPEYRAYIYNDQQAFNAILTESIPVDFETKMVVVIISTQKTNTKYCYRKMVQEGSCLKINESYYHVVINNTLMLHPYQSIDVFTIDKIDVTSVELNRFYLK